MGFNTFPCNPYPISTDELNKGNNDELNTRVASLESDVSSLEEQKANQITIALPFNPETTYEVGDIVYYNGLSYRCTNEHTGEWDADDFAGTTIANEISTLKSGLTNVAKYTSNANGEAWQFESGLMICKKTVTQTVAWTAWGTLYESDSIDFGSFPVAFSVTPVVNVSANNSGTSGISTGATGVTTTSAGSGKVVRPTDPGSQAITVGIAAVGRWS